MMSQTKKLSIAFYWHMHQPVYSLSVNGDFLMPWVRLHAVKDYLDMALWAKKFDKLKLNFNYTPVLLDSIIDYAQKDAHDIHSRLTITPEDKLTKEDKIFILNNFFDSNYQTMILPNDEYHRLYQIVQAEGTGAAILVSKDVFNKKFSDQEADFDGYMERLVEDIEEKASEFAHVKYFEAYLYADDARPFISDYEDRSGEEYPL